MIQTDVDIVNLALVKLGAQPVVSLSTPTTPIERRAALVYPHLRDSELSMRRWRFALRRRRLAAGVKGDCNTYTFALPTDPFCLRPLRQRDSVWEIEGRFIVSDDPCPVRLLYIARVPETDFDPTFSEALSAKVAEQLAEVLTQSNEKKDRATQMYKDAIKAAGLVNAYETGAETINYHDSNSEFLTGRYATGGIWDRWAVLEGEGCCGGDGGDVIVDGGLEGGTTTPALFNVTVDPTTEGGNNARQRVQSPDPATLGYTIKVDGGREG